MAVDKFKQLIAVQVPGMKFADSLFLNAGSLLVKGLNLVRKYRIFFNRDHAAAIGVGRAIQFVVGGNPVAKDVARFTFLALSVLKCAEDLAWMKESIQELKGHMTGREPVFIRKDPSFQQSSWSKLGIRFDLNLLWYSKVGVERMKRSMVLIAHLVKRLASLALHIGDVKAALTEDHLSAVIVHGNALWKKLTDKESILAKKLTAMEKQTDKMLNILNPSFTTALFLKIITIPVKVKEVLPESDDIKAGIKRRLDKGKVIVSAILEEMMQVDPSLRNYQSGPKEMDPYKLKLVQPPIRKVAI